MRVGHCAVIEFNSESDAKEEIKKFSSARSTFFLKQSLSLICKLAPHNV